MTRILFALALSGAVLGAFSAPASADPVRELGTCVACHDVTSAKRPMAGPPLFGIMGTPPKGPGIAFAKWDRASMDQWLKDPAAVKPTTSMAFKLKNDAKRAKVIEALSALK